MSAVAILNRRDEDCWESTLIGGALWYYCIPVRNCANLPQLREDDLCVEIPAFRSEGDEQPSPLRSHCRTVVLAGRNLTRQHLRKPLPVAGNEILVYGEPYALISQLARDRKMGDALKGKAILGPLLDPREYRTPPVSTRQAGWAAVMTSLGCQKRCAYCSHGVNSSYLYGQQFSRRSRPWQAVREELAQFVTNGITQFVLLADQFLSPDPEKNCDLLSLATHWDSQKLGQPILVFTVSPRDVLSNQSLFEALAHSFQLHPKLSIDSFDNGTLQLLDLDFDAATALEALRFFASLQLHFRINYLFLRPGVTLENLREEFSFFHALDGLVAYLNPYEKLMLAFDLFSGSLRVVSGTPVEKKLGVRARYEGEFPPELLKAVIGIQGAMEQELHNLPNLRAADPLRAVLNAGLKEITVPR